jgi:Arc/MetJ-type ribon-helix-helix transcriptional regulator
VASGDYATESDVIRDGLRSLHARDAAVDGWLCNEVAKSYNEYATIPDIGVPASKIMSRLKKSHAARLAKSKS